VIVVNRFREGADEEGRFRADLQRALEALAACPGHVRGRIGRNTDEPELWVLVTEWERVGDYRRALSSYEVKLTAVPVLSRSIDEPSAFETVTPGTDLNVGSPRSIP
jgi:quinol monooxygenase YgiN